MKELIEIQSRLKAPKSQRNTFGNYNYRSCEDILEAVKPLLKELGCYLTLSDEIVEVGGRVYVKATASILNEEGAEFVKAYARESDTKKGMDASQITGAASSYARKYALNGLFLIDDTKDADATNKHDEPERPPVDLDKLQSSKGRKHIASFNTAQEAIERAGQAYHVGEVARALITDIWHAERGEK